jgi:hypothetical protein
MSVSFFLSGLGASIIGANTNGWIGLGVWFCLSAIYAMIHED